MKQKEGRGGQLVKSIEQSKDSIGERQNPASASLEGDPIQRSVGFEFQANWRVGHRTPEGQWVEYPKTTPVYKKNDKWTLETDGNELEFVVDPPFEETAEGWQELDQVMGEIHAFSSALVEQKNEEVINKRNHPDLFTISDDGVEIQPQAVGLIAQPQATAGIRLDRITDLFQAISQEGSDASQDFLGSQSKLAREAYTRKAGEIVTSALQMDEMIPISTPPEMIPPELEGHQNSRKLEGLVTMIIQYLKRGSTRAGIRYAKYIAFMMARTDFGAMFNDLPAEERNYLKDHPERWIELILTAANMLDDNAEVIERTITDGMGSQRVIPVTRRQWLTEMTKGKDVLTAKEQPEELDPKGGNRLRALGLLGGAFDTVGEKKEGAIFEFREMPKHLDYSQWPPFAASIFSYILRLNASEEESPPKYGSLIS